MRSLVQRLALLESEVARGEATSAYLRTEAARAAAEWAREEEEGKADKERLERDIKEASNRVVSLR